MRKSLVNLLQLFNAVTNVVTGCLRTTKDTIFMLRVSLVFHNIVPLIDLNNDQFPVRSPMILIHTYTEDRL